VKAILVILFGIARDLQFRSFSIIHLKLPNLCWSIGISHWMVREIEPDKCHTQVEHCIHGGQLMGMNALHIILLEQRNIISMPTLPWRSENTILLPMTKPLFLKWARKYYLKQLEYGLKLVGSLRPKGGSTLFLVLPDRMNTLSW